MLKRSSVVLAATAAAAALLLAACSSSSSSSSAAATTPAKSTRACVILPDSASSPRWEQGDRPALQAALTAGGFTVDIQNAQGDTAKFGTIADQQLAGGCGVMILADLQGAGIQVAAKAKAQGIPVIAYDRPLAGAAYYVSFDNVKVGGLEGQMIVDGLKAAGKNPKTASVVYVGGDPADGNAKMFRDGAVAVMSAAGIKPAGETPGVWDGAKATTYFEQVFTKLKGKVDAVWVANDTNAAGVITILDKNHMKVPVSGQDASLAGLQNVLLGKQTGTVYKPYKLEADAASAIAIAILKGQTPTVNSKLPDGTPFEALTPISVNAANVESAVVSTGAAGVPTAAEICTGAVAAACTKYGVK